MIVERKLSKGEVVFTDREVAVFPVQVVVGAVAAKTSCQV